MKERTVYDKVWLLVEKKTGRVVLQGCNLDAFPPSHKGYERVYASREQYQVENKYWITGKNKWRTTSEFIYAGDRSCVELEGGTYLLGEKIRKSI
jgi:hypothetical protein